MNEYLKGIGRGLTAYAERHSRMDEVNRLNAKSDVELAAMGLQRRDIPRYVYRDIFFV